MATKRIDWQMWLWLHWSNLDKYQFYAAHLGWSWSSIPSSKVSGLCVGAGVKKVEARAGLQKRFLFPFHVPGLGTVLDSKASTFFLIFFGALASAPEGAHVSVEFQQIRYFMSKYSSPHPKGGL